MKKSTLSRLLAVLMVVLMAFSAIPAASLSAASAAKTSASAAANVKLSKCTFTYEKGQVYTGKARKPAVTVTYGKKTLVNGTDYTVSYKNNKAIGIATMTVTAKSGSGFTGSKTLKFVIRPAKVKGLTSTKQNTSAVRLSWTAVKGATGYRVYRYDAKTKTWVKAKNVTGTVATIKKLAENTAYIFMVRAFAKADGKVYWSVNSAKLKVKTKAQPVTPVDPQPVDPQPVDPQPVDPQPVDPQPVDPDPLAKVTGLKAVKNGKSVNLTWNAVANAPSYHICSYDPATKKYTSLMKSTTNKATLTGLTMEKTYYIAVRAFAEGSGETIYGDFSDLVRVTVYYADYYGALFRSGTFQATIKTNMEGMTDPITIATKNGNLYLKTKMAVSDSGKVDVQILYLKKSGKTYLCMSGLWFDATSVMDGDESLLDIAAIFGELDFGNNDNITVSTEKHGDTTYNIETISNGTDNYTKLYIKNGTLVKIVTVENGTAATSITFSSITDQVDDSLFKKPKYPLDLAAFGGMV